MDYSEIIQKLQECSYMIEEILNYVTIPFEPAVLKAQSFDAVPFSDPEVIASPFLDDTYTSMKQLNSCIKPVTETLSLNITPPKEQLQDLLNHITVVTNQMTGCWNGDSAGYFTDNLEYIAGYLSRFL